MLKNMILFRCNSDFIPLDAMEEALQRSAFTACGATQHSTAGWVPPRGHEHGALVESIAGQWILQLKTEQKILPAPVVKRRVEEMAKAIEQQTGRKPGKKERKNLKEEATLELLSKAFTRQTTTRAWMTHGLLAIDATTTSRADTLISLLVEAVPTLQLSLLQTQDSPVAGMTMWLMDGVGPGEFSIDRDGEIKAVDETKSVVRYQRHQLDTEEVRSHLVAGMQPTKLAMTFSDRVSFVLTDSLQLRRIALLDLTMEGRSGDEDAFDADVAIATAELKKLIDALVYQLGGEFVPPVLEEPASPAPHHGDEPDPIYDQAVQVVRTHGKPSISLVQRHLRIGYNRAARLLERMEIEGLVSVMKSDGSRELRMATA